MSIGILANSLIENRFKKFKLQSIQCSIHFDNLNLDWFRILMSLILRFFFSNDVEQKGELPPGRTAFASNNSAASSLRDMDIENELNELRRRANDY